MFGFVLFFFPLSYCGTRKFSAECKMRTKIGNRPKQTLKVKTKTLFISGNCGRYLKTGDMIQRDGLENDLYSSRMGEEKKLHLSTSRKIMFEVVKT